MRNVENRLFMKFTAKQIAEILDGKIEGDPEKVVSKLSKIEEGEEGSLTFLANPAYTHYIYKTNASVAIVNNDFIPEHPINATLIRVKDAYSSFAKLLEVYNKIIHNKTGISEQSYVHPTAKLGKDTYVGEFAWIGENVTIGNNVKVYPQVYLGDNVSIGDNTIIFAGVRVYTDCMIGSSCSIHSGVIIGGDGFGFAPQADNGFHKIAQIGNVVIEDNVEVGANTTIDRATLGSTIIRKGVKLDNLIQIAHNVEIGENTVIVSQTGIAGSTKIGKNCMIGGQVGIIGHLTIADNVKIAAQSGISSNITKKGAIVMGSPAFEMGAYKKSYVHFKNLHSTIRRLEELERNTKKEQ